MTRALKRITEIEAVLEPPNITRLLKGTGCGPGEIGGLVLADVSFDGEVPFVWIRPGSETAENRQTARTLTLPSLSPP